MAVALNAPTQLAPVPGIRLAAGAAGIRYQGRADLLLIDAGPEAAIAALFTTNAFSAAPVQVARAHLAAGVPRWLLINAGNANAGTGSPGVAAAHATCAALAQTTQTPASGVLPFSTGVIGEPLPVDRIRTALPGLVEGLREDAWMPAARAIMTTDTVPKGASRTVTLTGGTITLTGIAKGSGMIHPDMATMFCFLTTDAPVERQYLSDALRRAVDVSLNMISVDNDTSTSDTVAILANGAGGGPEITSGSADARPFEEALGRACTAIARMLARDGEGATKLIEVRVEGAATPEEARAAARTISASPLVKTAMHGNDPNWGRILMAAGRSGARTELSRAHVWLGETVVYAGAPVKFDEVAASDYLRAEEVLLRVDLGAGTDSATAWGCDMSHDYVHINSDYTT
jgi:glutamate N-acetyltransferase / amino-acid N-acetyltransferase